MLKPERYERIVQLVNTKGTATVEELSEELNVSKATIRRDLVQLGQDKVILRTHGGAMKCDRSITAEVPIYLRIHMQKQEKERVGAAAAQVISEGDTIYIAAGTTGRMLATQLHRFRHLTVVTNDIDIAREVSFTENSLIVVGGQLKHSSSTLVGFFAEEMLRELRVDIAFMAADAVDMDKGFMDFSVDEISLKRQVLAIADKSVMMCDISKFEKPAFVNICPFSSVYAMVTNEETDPEKIAAIREMGVMVILAPTNTDEELNQEVTK